jgi:hypothetical protein
MSTWRFPAAAPNRHVQGEAMSLELPRVQAELMHVRLRVLGRPEMDSSYTLAYRELAPASTI